VLGNVYLSLAGSPIVAVFIPIFDIIGVSLQKVKE